MTRAPAPPELSSRERARALVRELRAQAVEVWAEAGELKLRAPRGVLDAALRERLRELKPALLAVLAEAANQAPLTAAQRQLWFVDQVEGRAAGLELILGLELRGDLDRAALERALVELVVRHEALRTRFSLVAGEPVQIVTPITALDGARLWAEPGVRPDLDGRPMVASLVARGPEVHELCLRVHHIVCDGWSMSVLVEELGRLYSLACDSTVSPAQLPALTSSPRAVARELASREAKAGTEARLDAWARRFVDARPVALPFDRERTALATTSGTLGRAGGVDVDRRRVAPEVWAAALARAGLQGATGFAIFATAALMVLARWTGAVDLCVGLPYANRPRAELEGLVAMLVDTLLVRVELDRSEDFDATLTRVRDASLASLAHADLPLDRVIARLHQLRGARVSGSGDAALPNVMLNFAAFAEARPQFAGLDCRFVASMPGARFDLTIYAYPRGGGLDLEAAYRPELFDGETIAALLDQIAELLERGPSAGAGRAWPTIALGPAEAPGEAPGEALVEVPGPVMGALVARVAAAPPTALAIVGPTGSRSYAQLALEAAVWAQALAQGLGDRRPLRVALLARRSPSLLVALVALDQAGLGFVILDLAHPPQRLIELAKIAKPDGWIDLDSDAPAELVAALDPGTQIRRPQMSGAPSLRAPGERSDDPSGDPSGEPSYLAFTSGTSGRPRAVVARFGAVTHFLAAYAETLGLRASDRFASLSGLGHDPTLRDLLGPVWVGACVCLPPEEPSRMGPALGQWLLETGVTVLHLTPVLARAIAAGTREPLLALRYVGFGGDQLRGEDVARWRTLAPNAVLLNFYGTTETPQVVAMHRVRAEDGARSRVPIGRGVGGASVEVVTDAGLAVVGEVGEIVVRSAQLAHAYLDEPELSAARFIPGPRYRTGDLGRVRHDGEVVCLGRRDDQVEIRGVRVEPAEVEAVVAAVAGRPSAVVARPAGGPGQLDRALDRELELVAWIVADHLDAAELARVRAEVAARLPAAMVPTRWAVTDALPLTANAKLDRRALAGEDPGSAKLGGPGTGPGSTQAPRGPREQAVAEIWAELLGLELGQIGRDADFFALGGHSLLAVALAVAIEERLGLRLSIPALFDGPSLAACAAALEGVGPGSPASGGDLPGVAVGDPSPASFAQARIWLLHELDADAGVELSITHTLRLDEALDLELLDRALVELERRHVVLRTRFALTSEGLVAQVEPARARVLIQGPPPPRRPRFELETGPVWRAYAWTHSDGQAFLDIELHHIAGEAGSMGILARDLCELIVAARDARPPQLPALRGSHAAFARAQRERAATPDGREALARRVASLSGLAPLELPLARPRPGRQRYRGAWTDRALDPGLIDGLHARASAEMTTVFGLGLAALSAVLARWSGADDFAIAVPIGLRPDPTTHELIGPFLDLAILRLDVRGDPTLDELVARAGASFRAGLAARELPFEELVRALDSEAAEAGAGPRELGRAPVAQVLFNMVTVGETEEHWAKIGATRVLARAPVARQDLALYLVEESAGLRLGVIHDTDLFAPAQITQLLDHLERTLSVLVEAPPTRVSQLGLRPPPGVDTLARPQPSAVGPRDPSQVWDEIAAAQPERVALDLGTQRFTYAELHARSCAVAAALAGAPRSDPGWARVGLLVYEDATMVAGMFGALARGVAYVPLDPRLPEPRLAELVADAELDAILAGARCADLGRMLAGSRPCLVIDELPAVSVDERGPGRGQPEPDALAYLLYTSGSTGRPKGVMQSRTNLLRHALTYAASLDLGPEDRLSLVSTHAFDAGVMDIYAALLSGATLCPIDLRGEALVDLGAVLRARGVTVLHGTPTVIRHLVASLREAPAEPEPEPFWGLRWVVLGGEEARYDDAAAIRATLGPKVGLINGLGPTECTVALQARFEPGQLDGRASAWPSLPIGRPAAGVAVRLETKIGEQVALYGVGELVLDSPHVALGYWNRPELDAAAFERLATGRRYRGGDLARWLPGGVLGFVGRRGGFVKLRGHRIEPAEVEAKLRELVGVRDAAVEVRDGELLAWVEADLESVSAPESSAPESGPDPEQLRRLLAARLPGAMVPSRILVVARLPQTHTGKLDRRALAAWTLPAAPATPDSGGSGGPEDPASIAVSQLWAEIVGGPVDVDLDLFAAGGDSLAAARLVRALSRRLGLDLSLAELFTGHTPASLARRLRGEVEPGLGRARLHRLGEGDGKAPRPTWVIVLPPGQRPSLVRALAASPELGAPVLALEPPSFGVDGPLPTIAEISASLRATLAEVELGPMWLAGVSNGGLLAWHLARDLNQGRDKGPSLRGLALLDSFPPALLAARPWSARTELDHLRTFVELMGGPSTDGPEPVGEARDWAEAAVRAVMPGASPALFEALYEHYRVHAERVWQRLSTLALPDLGPDLVPVLVEAEAGRWRQLGERWGEIMAGIEVVPVPGSHLGMFASPAVDELAAILRALERRGTPA